VLDPPADTLHFVTPVGRLAAVHDRQLRLSVHVAGLGELTQPASGLLAFTGNRRLVVMRPDGSRVANAGWNPADETLASLLGVSADRKRFVFELVRAGPRARSGPATLYVLRPGGRSARLLFRWWRSPLGCIEGDRCAAQAGFDWSGDTFLFEPGDGHAAAIDSRTGHAVDLTRFDRSLPHLGPRPEEATIAWKTDFPR
jgi:hypothetical protein